jgi:FtsZ-interacting cell division protein YlmF
MEQTLISSGFKLLSEIRIGSTGIDYLGVAKDKLVVVQLDTTEGNWFASEDKVEGNDAPVWFSELGNKISPVARAIEAKNNIAELINGKIDLPIESVACLSRSKVVNMPQTQQVRMVISQPTTFEQAEEICSYLKNRKSVIVNLEYVNKDVARRIVDVMSGAVHALDGHIQKISNSIFLIAPTYYEISTEIARDEIKNKLSVSWLKNG